MMLLKHSHGALCITLILVGCAASTKPAPIARLGEQNNAPITSADACATRLQDISGDLLLYYAINHHLPQTLDELSDLPDIGQVPPLVCPVSHQPYIYDRVGIPLPGQDSRIVLYDATPAHSGYRWGITVSTPQAGKPLVMKVIALSESIFTSQSKQQ
jgi:hypothetical protein